MPEIDERLLRTVALATCNRSEVELQPVKIEADFADAHLAMDAGGDAAGQHMPQHRRNREICREAGNSTATRTIRPDFAHASRTAQLLRARNPRLQRGETPPSRAS